jgi:hypothetical protein
MAFKPVLDLHADRSVSIGGTNKTTGAANPRSIEGYYIGSRDIPDKFSKTALGKLYILRTPEGNIGVYGKPDMNKQMVNAKLGNMVRISFVRSVPSPRGQWYKYLVEEDKENTVEVSLPIGLGNVDDVEEFDGDEENEESTDSSDDNEFSTAASIAEAKRVAAKAKVAALLSGKTKTAKG